MQKSKITSGGFYTDRVKIQGFIEKKKPEHSNKISITTPANKNIIKNLEQELKK